MTKTPSNRSPQPPIRVGVVCDYAEELWASMDLVADMILGHLAQGHADQIDAKRIQPPFRRRFSRTNSGVTFNVDRLINRYFDYRNYMRKRVDSNQFDVFHVVDHSYAQLVHELPPGHAVVTCHDLDTFRCLLEPQLEPRPRWFRAMAKRTLTGFQKASAVCCNSETTYQNILKYGLLPAERLYVTYMGVSSEFTPSADAQADAEIAQLLGGRTDQNVPPDLLHVGTNIPRKRIDVLLDTFAGVRRAIPGTRLLKVGGGLTGELAAKAEQLGVSDAIVTLPFLSRAQLAAIYRRADLALFPSDAEGFGFPVAEAMASGCPVLISDIPVFREVGGTCALYAPVGDVPAWIAATVDILSTRHAQDSSWQTRRAEALNWSARYRWTTHAQQLVEVYQRVMESHP